MKFKVVRSVTFIVEKGIKRDFEKCCKENSMKLEKKLRDYLEKDWRTEGKISEKIIYNEDTVYAVTAAQIIIHQ